MSAQLLWDEIMRDVRKLIRDELADYRPDLARSTGVVPGNHLPTSGNTGSGYTPVAHAASHEAGGGDTLDLGLLAGELTDSQHGDRGGGALHAVATSGAAGFLSAADKAKLDSIAAIALANQSANTVFAGPPSGAAAAPAFRALVAADIPNLDTSKLTSGQLALARGGTGADLSATGGANQVVRQSSAGGALSVSVLAAADIPSLDSSKITSGEIPRSPLTTRGDLLTRDATTHARVAIGAAGRYLRSDGTDPSWAQLDMGDAAAGTLPAARGGTGLSSYAVGDLLYASGSSVLSKLADVAAGNALISGGVGAAPSWGKIDLTTHITGVLSSANGGTGVNNGSFTLTFPASGTAALRASAATAGRLGFWSSASEISHDANLVWDGTNQYVEFHPKDNGGGVYIPFKVADSGGSLRTVFGLSSGATPDVIFNMPTGQTLKILYNAATEVARFTNTALLIGSPASPAGLLHVSGGKVVIGENLSSVTNSLVLGKSTASSEMIIGQSATARFQFAWFYNATETSAYAQFGTLGDQDMRVITNGLDRGRITADGTWLFGRTSGLTGAGDGDFNGNVRAATFRVGLNQVVGARVTGWALPTGTLSRATFDQSTVTLTGLAQRVAALITDLYSSHGLIGA